MMTFPHHNTKSGRRPEDAIELLDEDSVTNDADTCSNRSFSSSSAVIDLCSDNDDYVSMNHHPEESDGLISQSDDFLSDVEVEESSICTQQNYDNQVAEEASGADDISLALTNESVCTTSITSTKLSLEKKEPCLSSSAEAVEEEAAVASEQHLEAVDESSKIHVSSKLVLSKKSNMINQNLKDVTESSLRSISASLNTDNKVRFCNGRSRPIIDAQAPVRISLKRKLSRSQSSMHEDENNVDSYQETTVNCSNEGD